MPWDGMQSWFTDFVSGSISKNHLEEKKIFISENAYVVNLGPAVMILPFGSQHDICDTVQYKDVTDRLVAASTFTVDADVALGTGSVVVDMLSVQQQPRYPRQVMCPHQP